MAKHKWPTKHEQNLPLLMESNPITQLNACHVCNTSLKFSNKKVYTYSHRSRGLFSGSWLHTEYKQVVLLLCHTRMFGNYWDKLSATNTILLKSQITQSNKQSQRPKRFNETKETGKFNDSTLQCKVIMLQMHGHTKSLCWGSFSSTTKISAE